MAGATRGRDLKVSFLTDLEQFNTDDAAAGLEDVAGKADEVGKSLVDLDRDATTAKGGLDDVADKADAAGKALLDVDDNTGKAGKALHDFDRDAATVARKVDDSFDKIARSSKANLRDKIDDDLDHAKAGLDDFKSEAAGSGREAAASFGGGFDDVTSFVQETAANAFSGFGPIGAVAGTAAAIGIGLITKAFETSKEQAEEAKQKVGEYVQAFIDGQGRIQEATIATNLQNLFGDLEGYKKLSTDAKEAGVSITLLARAKAGDLDAAQKLSARVNELSESLTKNKHRTTDSEAATLRQENALDRVADTLGITKGQLSTAESAWKDLDEATRAGIVANVDVDAPTPRELRNEAAQMKGTLGKPITVPVKIDAVKAARIALLEADRYFRDHPITLRTKAGARPIRDVP